MHPVKDKNKVVITMDWLEEYPNKQPFIRYGLAKVPHKGLDFAPTASFKKDSITILAPVSGLIKTAFKWNAPDDIKAYKDYLALHPFGGLVKIVSSMSDKGFTHYLAHMSDILVSEGARVTKGTPIGIMGTTGKSSGVHLHYGVKNIVGEWVDPTKYCT